MSAREKRPDIHSTSLFNNNPSISTFFLPKRRVPVAVLSDTVQFLLYLAFSLECGTNVLEQHPSAFNPPPVTFHPTPLKIFSPN